MAAAAQAVVGDKAMFKRWFVFLLRLWRHRWLDADDARRLLPPPAQQRLAQAVAASEQRHTGEICLCIEGGLPVSYLWRSWRQGLSLDTIVRQRALMLFGKLGVWDTEHNNGVLIYLLLAEQRIELVADRALAQQWPVEHWQELVQRLSGQLQAHRFESGLSECLNEVSQLLEQHFATNADTTSRPDNQIPNAPVFV